MRFTLPKLFLAVTFAALACAGLTLRTRFWVELIFTLSVLLFLVAALTGVGQSGRGRVSSFVFALVGGGYLLIVSCNVFSPIRNLLLTNRALVLAGRALHVSTNEFGGSFGGGGFQGGGFGGGGFQVADPVNANTVNKGFGGFTGAAAMPSAYDFEAYAWDNDSFAFGVPIADPKIPAAAFLIIGHCVWSWLLAWLAGWLCGAIWQKSRDKQGAKAA